MPVANLLRTGLNKTKLRGRKKIQLFITDERMLGLPDILKNDGVIRFRQQFCDAIEIPKQNIRNIANGIQHFTATHITNACWTFNVDPAYVNGFTNDVYRKMPLPKELPKDIEKLIKRQNVKNKTRTG